MMNMIKRMIVLLLLGVLLSSHFSISIAEYESNAPEIDFNLLENSPLFSYNKFEKTWSITGWYTYKYSDGIFGLGIVFWDTFLDSYAPEIRTYINYDTGESVASIVEIKILLDDTIYCFTKMENYEDTFSYVCCGSVLRQFLKTLPVSNDIALQYIYDNSDTVIIDDISVSDMQDIIAAGELLEKSGIWDTCQNAVEIIDAEYGAYIDGDIIPDEEIEARLVELSATSEPTSAPAPNQYSTLKKGDKGDDVKTLQQRLIELNYLSGSADGDYGGKTASAVELFQSSVDLTTTGVADPDTQAALFASDAPKAKVYQSINYKAMSRDPNTYEGNLYKFDGKVVQVLEEAQNDGTTLVSLRVASKGNFDDIVYVVYSRTADELRVLEDDRVTVYGTSRGLYSYETVMGNEITIPLIIADTVTVK